MAEHIRESATPTELLIKDGETLHPTGLLIGDCSCGGWYYADAGGDDEYGALERAHAEHVARAERATAAVREWVERS